MQDLFEEEGCERCGGTGKRLSQRAVNKLLISRVKVFGKDAVLEQLGVGESMLKMLACGRRKWNFSKALALYEMGSKMERCD